MKSIILYSFTFFTAVAYYGCKQPNTQPGNSRVADLQLKSGELISCGPAETQFGSLNFEVSAKGQVYDDFNLGVKLLHSFEYDEAEKIFAKILSKDTTLAMAYWGVAMSNFHPLWTPPSGDELKKGSKAIEIARSAGTKTVREAAYIDALYQFYKDNDKLDHAARTLKFESAMGELQASYPNDKEASIFYALAILAAADPADKTFARQKKAASILNGLYSEQPHHPGIIHYIIHTYDYPTLATDGLEAAKKYASVAPSSAHALHMPSHIFIRLGMWDESIKSNMNSVSSAICYAEAAGIKGHWDEELHGLDYLVYAHLQTGNNTKALWHINHVKTFKEASPANFKVAYALAAIPSRYVLENHLWQEASSVSFIETNLDWKKYPWQAAIVHFTRLMGAIHIKDHHLMDAELSTLKELQAELIAQKDGYKATQVAIQVKTGEAWMSLNKGQNDTALAQMKTAADMEDKSGKHPVTPGEVIPARELLADMLMVMHRYKEAHSAYDSVLSNSPNRFNSLYGAGLSAEKMGGKSLATKYYRKLISITGHNSERFELIAANEFLAKSK